jgi:hypothetical protein
MKCYVKGGLIDTAPDALPKMGPQKIAGAPRPAAQPRGVPKGDAGVSSAPFLGPTLNMTPPRRKKGML